jgi:hypothetical protein
MIAQVLQNLIDQKLTTAREIGDLAGVSSSTVYRWLERETQPDFNSIRLLLRHLPHRGAQEAVLTAFLAGTGWTGQYVDADLDFNHDGKVDCEDALDAAIESVEAASEALAEVRQCTRERAISPAEATKLAALLTEVVRDCTTTQRIMVRICEDRRRHKAGPLDPPRG